MARCLPSWLVRGLRPVLARALLLGVEIKWTLRVAGFGSPASCRRALQAFGDDRRRFVDAWGIDPLLAPPPAAWPAIDLSVVTHGSGEPLDALLASLLAQDYPLERIHLRIVDTAAAPATQRARLPDGLASCELLQRADSGFGAAHDVAIAAGSSPFCLIMRDGITFEADALCRIVSIALADAPDVACWELRQIPFERSVIYDPVTGLTNLNRHDCALLRRSAYRQAGGFDQRITSGGDDIALSYRLRNAGYRLRYCPMAAVNCRPRDNPPRQTRGGMFANLYLRLCFGRWRDIAMIPCLTATRLVQAPAGARRDVLRAVRQALRHAPLLLRSRRLRRDTAFPFRGWDYDFARPVSPVQSRRTPSPSPLVSIVTRTHGARGQLLSQALFAVAHQVYPHIEHIVVEDGGEAMRPVIDRVAARTGRPIRYIPLAKVGRSAAGNAGLAAATGEFFAFLDDDDLYFHDHIEVLVNALLADPAAVAGYALAWEVPTIPTGQADGDFTEIGLELHPVFKQEFDFAVLSHHNYMPIQTVLCRRSLFAERGGFDTGLEALEDWNLWQRYAFGNRFVYVPKVTSLFRTPADRATRLRRARVLDAAYEPVRQRTRDMLRTLAGQRSA